VSVVTGTVTSGIGDLGRWMVLYADAYEAETGVRLYPGSLNVLLRAEYRLPAHPPMRLRPEVLGGRVGMNIVPCTIRGVAGFVLRTDQNEAGVGDHGRDIIEIGATVRLRDALDLSDGDTVSIEIDDGRGR
jgi:CTP-dependent riboflavin kinase